MKKIFALCFLLIISYGQTIDTVVEWTLMNSPLIKERISEIASLQHKRNLESTYKNPTLTLGANDLLLSDFFNREAEAMQTHFITLSQELDTNGKLGLQKSLLQSKIEKLELSLLDLKHSLTKEIKTLHEDIAIKETILTLQTQKLQNLKKMKEYHHNTINTQDFLNQSIIMEKNIFLLEDKILETQSIIHEKKLKFFNITQLNYEPLSDTKQPKFDKSNLYKTPKYKIYLSNIEESNNALLIAKSATLPNITLNLGYNQRVNRDDYLFVSLMFPLQIYGRETNKIDEQSNLVKKTESHEESYKLDVEKEFATLEQNLTYLNQRVASLQALISEYNQLLNYNENNINTSNILKTLEVQNTLIDFEILKKTLELQIITTELQLEYLTSEDLS